jgi:hypothetical protein
MNMDQNPTILAKVAVTTIRKILASVAPTSTPISAVEIPKTLYNAIDPQLYFQSKDEKITTATTPTTCHI